MITQKLFYLYTFLQPPASLPGLTNLGSVNKLLLSNQVDLFYADYNKNAGYVWNIQFPRRYVFPHFLHSNSWFSDIHINLVQIWSTIDSTHTAVQKWHVFPQLFNCVSFLPRSYSLIFLLWVTVLQRNLPTNCKPQEQHNPHSKRLESNKDSAPPWSIRAPTRDRGSLPLKCLAVNWRSELMSAKWAEIIFPVRIHKSSSSCMEKKCSLYSVSGVRLPADMPSICTSIKGLFATVCRHIRNIDAVFISMLQITNVNWRLKLVAS